MEAIITPNLLSGTVRSISSKSYAHRMLICASFSDKPTYININSQLSEDIKATINCLTSLGAKIENLDSSLKVTPISSPTKNAILDCNESGSTLRFLIPVVSALGCNATFIGKGKLPNRPIDSLSKELKKHGVKFSSETLPLNINGKLSSNIIKIDGSLSSQFVTGILLALPLIGGGKVIVTSPLKSESYVDITCNVLNSFGIEVVKSNNEYIIPSCNGYISPNIIDVPSDWSNSAFFFCCGAISDKITLQGIDNKSIQGDKEILSILKQYGAEIEIQNDNISVSPAKRKPLNINASNIPDLVPIISVLCSVATGTSTITNVDRLKFKESDRIKSTIEMINSLGGNAQYKDNEIIINGKDRLIGGNVNGYNDHRIVMSASIASCVCEKDVTITDFNAINKSYPNFSEDFKALGGKMNVI